MNLFESLVYKDRFEKAKCFPNARYSFHDLSKKSEEEREIFFKELENEEREIFFYDYTLAERNMYIPACKFWGLLLSVKIGRKKYKEYIQAGAMYGILSKHGYEIIESEHGLCGAFCGCLAIRKKVLN